MRLFTGIILIFIINYQNNNANVDGKFIVFGSNIGNFVCIYLLGSFYVLEVTELTKVSLH